MAFIDGNNGENFISEDLIPASHTLVFYCPVHKQSLEPQECFDCGMFINAHCMMGVERILYRKEK